jgi:hypothetical protein
VVVDGCVAWVVDGWVDCVVAGCVGCVADGWVDCVAAGEVDGCVEGCVDGCVVSGHFFPIGLNLSHPQGAKSVQVIIAHNARR